MYGFHQFEIPTAIKHGIGAVKHVGERIKALGVSKALLVTDFGIYNAGVPKPVFESLEGSVLDYEAAEGKKPLENRIPPLPKPEK